MREAGALAISLVASEKGVIIGHVAFSPVTIGCEDQRWYGLGPVSVWPDRQRKGIGQALIRAGLEQLRRLPAAGVVLIGDPGYYRRFGFANDPALRYGKVPPEYVQRMAFAEAVPRGEIAFHAAFGAS